MELETNDSHAEILLLNASLANTSNDDTTSLENTLKFKPILDIVFLACFVSIVISIGCEIKTDQLLYHIKRPIGISIGMLSQFVVLPLSAFSLLHCITVSDIRATGVLIMACCPGGPMSNTFVYFFDGDLSLSVSMTSLSTVIAMGMMPLNLWMYGRMYAGGRIVVPYAKLAISLLFATVPVGAGMFLRRKAPRFASIFTKATICISSFIILSYYIAEVFIFPNMFTSVSGALYAVMLCLPIIGFSLGYIVALLFRQNSVVRKTIAIECGIQNIPTSLAVIALSFPIEHQKELAPLPYLYSFSTVLGGIVLCCLYKAYLKFSSHKTAPKDHNVQEIDHDTAATLECEENIDYEPMLEPKRTDADVASEFLKEKI